MPRRGPSRKAKKEVLEDSPSNHEPVESGGKSKQKKRKREVKNVKKKEKEEEKESREVEKEPSSPGDEDSRRPAKHSREQSPPHPTNSVDEKPDEIEDVKPDEGTESRGRDLATCPPIRINRAPVLVLWVAVVAEREGFSFEEGLSFGQAISGMFAHSKGKSLGIHGDEKSEEHGKKKRKKVEEEHEEVEVFGRKLKAVKTAKGQLQALSSGKPVASKAASAYVSKAFGDRLEDASDAMRQLAARVAKDEIGHRAYHLYEAFRPNVPSGVRGWGAKGELVLSDVLNAGNNT